MDDVIHVVFESGRPEIKFVNFNIKVLIYAGYTCSTKRARETACFEVNKRLY